MDISPLRDGFRVLDARTPASEAAPSGAAGSGDGRFVGALKNAVDDLHQSQTTMESAAAKMAAGGPLEVHQVMLAAEQAKLQLMLAVEVRNRLLEAYQELSRV
jgi:flagellar hook-basal body complex protein FliE